MPFDIGLQGTITNIDNPPSKYHVSLRDGTAGWFTEEELDLLEEETEPSHSGKLFIFMGGSGSGKSSIQHSLPIDFMTNCTTRPLRSGEVDGHHIKQVSVDEFKKLEDENYFFETVCYAGNYYGTPNFRIKNLLEGKPYHCTKDIHGVIDLKKKLGDVAVAIYIKPPSTRAIIWRMIKRRDKLKNIIKRLKYLKETNELENEKYADYVIINDDLKEAQLEAHRIVIKELLKGVRQ
jgi:guanylate kinase